MQKKETDVLIVLVLVVLISGVILANQLGITLESITGLAVLSADDRIEVRVTSEANWSDSSAIATDASNNVYIVWADNRTISPEIYFVRLNRTGSNLTPITRLTTTTANWQNISNHPQLALDSSNDIHIVWEDLRNGEWQIFYKKINQNGNQVIGDTQIDTTSINESLHPDIAVDNSNNIHIVWEDWGYVNITNNDTNSEIVYKKLSNSGSELVAEKRITFNNHSSLIPRIAADSSNNIHLVWFDGRTGSGDIYYKKLDSSGDNLTGDIAVEDILEGTSSYPDIDIDSSNNLHVVWTDNRTGSWKIYYTKLDNNGTTLIDDMSISTGTGAEFPRIAVNGSGYVNIVWNDDKSATNTDEAVFYAALLDGTVTVNPIQLTDQSFSYFPDIALKNDSYPAISFVDNRDGNFEIYYMSSEDDGDGDNYTTWPGPNQDCNDNNALINPGATEVCDGVDNDCDGQVDEGCPTGGAAPSTRRTGGCFSVWNCTDWSVCSPEGIQARECVDTGTCRKSDRTEVRTCTYVQTCRDGIINQDETDIDCGGIICPKCEDGMMCNTDEDCLNKCNSVIGRCYSPEAMPSAEEEPSQNVLLVVLLTIIFASGLIILAYKIIMSYYGQALAKGHGKSSRKSHRKGGKKR